MLNSALLRTMHLAALNMFSILHLPFPMDHPPSHIGSRSTTPVRVDGSSATFLAVRCGTTFLSRLVLVRPSPFICDKEDAYVVVFAVPLIRAKSSVPQ
jgi:hypothetical protein